MLYPWLIITILLLSLTLIGYSPTAAFSQLVNNGEQISDSTHSDVTPKQAPKYGGIIPGNYNALMPPTSLDGGPIRVEFSILVVAIRDIREMDQEINLGVNFRVYWTDLRLVNLTDGKDFLVVNPSGLGNHIWIPDVFINNAKAIKQNVLMSKPTSLRLYRNGSVRYSARVSATVSCPMDFKYYPADTQNCKIELKSYAYPLTMLSLGWQPGHGVELVDGLSLANFYLKLEHPEEFTADTQSGVYSGLRFRIRLERRMSYHLLQTYLPSTMFIIVSWLTFIMPQDSGAVMICMTTLLTITASFAAVRQSTPTVSYAKAIDIWMAVCMFYVFLSLIQHTTTMRLRHMKFAKKPISPHRQSLMHAESNEEVCGEQDSTLQPMKLQSGLELDGESHPERRYARRRPTLSAHSVIQVESDRSEMEKITEYKLLGNKIRRLFSSITPLTFLVFNLFYWSWLLLSAAN